MEILDERFRSRFEWGLIVDITLPDYETRMAILHKKEDMDGYNVSEDVIKYIANNIKSNIDVYKRQTVSSPVNVLGARITMTRTSSTASSPS